MSKRALVTFGIFAAICVIGLPLWAILAKGSESAAPAAPPSSQEDAKELFATNCGPCHTLAAAGTDGLVGPDLDMLLGSGPASPETIKANYQRVLNAIQNGINGRMPAGILATQQAREVAHFVAENLEYLSQ